MSSRIISLSFYQKITKLLHPPCVDCTSFPWTFMENPEDGEKSYSTAKNLLIFTIKNIPLNRFKSLVIKSFIYSPSKSNVQVSSYAILICSCSHFCCIIFQISGFMYSHVLLIWLINVYWMLSLSWPKHWMIEVLPSKISIPFFPSVLFQKHCFYYCLFSSFSHSPFYFKLYKISTDCTPIGILWLVG